MFELGTAKRGKKREEKNDSTNIDNHFQLLPDFGEVFLFVQFLLFWFLGLIHWVARLF